MDVNKTQDQFWGRAFSSHTPFLEAGLKHTEDKLTPLFTASIPSPGRSSWRTAGGIVRLGLRVRSEPFSCAPFRQGVNVINEDVDVSLPFSKGFCIPQIQIQIPTVQSKDVGPVVQTLIQYR